jgi:hypothetical protein
VHRGSGDVTRFSAGRYGTYDGKEEPTKAKGELYGDTGAPGGQARTAVVVFEDATLQYYPSRDRLLLRGDGVNLMDGSVEWDVVERKDPPRQGSGIHAYDLRIAPDGEHFIRVNLVNKRAYRVTGMRYFGHSGAGEIEQIGHVSVSPGSSEE